MLVSEKKNGSATGFEPGHSEIQDSPNSKPFTIAVSLDKRDRAIVAEEKGASAMLLTD